MPANYVFAALIAAEGIAQIATIKSTKFAHGGRVTGGIPGVDSVHALLQQGEHVLTVPQVRELERAGINPAGIAGGGRGGSFGSETGGGQPFAGATFVFNLNGETVEFDPEEVFGPDMIRDMADKLREAVVHSGVEVVATSLLKDGRPTAAEDL